MKSSQVKEGSMHSMTLARYVMLPTPKATEIEENYSDWKERMVKSGNPKNTGKTTCNIGTMAISGMLPTPTVNDGPNSCLPQSQADRHSGLASVMLKDDRNIGETHQLNPAFVGEMMGFPPDWTLNPFIQGGTEIGQPTDFSNFPQFNPTISKGEIQDMDGITASKWRNESIKAYGNAIVPEVAYNIFQAINKYENR